MIIMAIDTKFGSLPASPDSLSSSSERLSQCQRNARLTTCVTDDTHGKPRINWAASVMIRRLGRGRSKF